MVSLLATVPVNVLIKFYVRQIKSAPNNVAVGPFRLPSLVADHRALPHQPAMYAMRLTEIELIVHRRRPAASQPVKVSR
jgi:hypothetical protein